MAAPSQPACLALPWRSPANPGRRRGRAMAHPDSGVMYAGRSRPMILISKTYWGGMPFWFPGARAPEQARHESVVLRTHDMRQLRALYWTSERPEHVTTKPKI